MSLYMKMSQNINKTTRHLKFRYISILKCYSAHLRETILFSYCISGSNMIYELGVYEERNIFFCC